MRIKYAVLALIMLFLNSGCYAEMTGTVVDAESGEPIEGSVVLIEWTKTKGLGLTYTTSYKIVEAITNKEGKYSASGVINPLINPPNVTVYKKGYVAWNDEFIFPDYRPREGFKNKNRMSIKLQRFKKHYSYDEHISFIRTCIKSSLNNSSKRTISDAFEWETKLALQERMKKRLIPKFKLGR